MLDNVNRTHIVLASGKLVLNKKTNLGVVLLQSKLTRKEASENLVHVGIGTSCQPDGTIKFNQRVVI